VYAPALFTHRGSRLSTAIRTLVQGQHVPDPSNLVVATTAAVDDVSNLYALPKAELKFSKWGVYAQLMLAIAAVTMAILMFRDLGVFAFIVCAALAIGTMVAAPAHAYARVRSSLFIRRQR
jgi:hypothetical protein